MSSDNPYSAPVSVDPIVEPLTDAEQTRNRYLKQEASVKSIGSLYMIGAFFAILGGIGVVVAGLSNVDGEPGGAAVVVGFGAVYLAIGVLYGATAIGIRRLKSWARWVAVVFSVLGLVGFPIGTLISGYFLYLLLSEKGTMVFSEPYKQVIAATPHIKYKTSIIVVIFVVLLFALLLIGVMAALFGAAA